MKKLPKRRPSGREKDEASVKLLEQLRQKLHSEQASVRRIAAFNLSWMQEDGLEILKEALYGDFSPTAKTAGAYGLRKMQGRMKKKALGVLEEGLKSRSRTTREVCNHALALLGKRRGPKTKLRQKPRKGKIPIREIPGKAPARQKVSRRNQSRK